MNPLTIITALLPAFQTAAPILLQLFPALTTTISALSTTNPASHTNIVSFVQEALNALISVGVIPSTQPLLTVDGSFGGQTFAAIKLLQTKVGLGFLSVEPIASLEYTLLQGLLAKL